MFMKRIQCKIWRECVGYLPAIVPIEDIPIKGHGINIDFTNCMEVHSSGLAIVLVRLLKKLRNTTGQVWYLDSSEKNRSVEIAVKLGLFDIISHKYHQQFDLFSPKVAVIHSAGSKCPIEQEFNGYIMQSYPIYPLRFTSGTTRREANRLFKKWLLDVLEPLGDRYRFHVNQLILILYEMGKNSADHTKDDAFFGMDFMSQNDTYELRFCFADLGEGIKMHVQKNLPPEITGRACKLGLVEAYYYALKHGYTSNPSSNENKGFGMTAILDGCQGLGIELSVFDARSRGLLTCITDNHSHAQLRKAFYSIGIHTGFYYYGLLKLKRKPLL